MNTIPAVYAVEQPGDLLAEIQPLLKRHWSELASNRDKVPLAPDYGRYARLAERGQLLVVTARDPVWGRLIGYWVEIILPEGSLHYQGTPFAETDIFWVDPDERDRGIGAGLLAMVEKILQERFPRIVIRGRSKLEHKAAGEILVNSGYTPVEIVFEKMLG